jgi:hypothetical protein
MSKLLASRVIVKKTRGLAKQKAILTNQKAWRAPCGTQKFIFNSEDAIALRR